MTARPPRRPRRRAAPGVRAPVPRYTCAMRTLLVVLALAASAPASAGPAARGASVHESYAPALAEARARGVPILVDVWAPW